MPPGFPPQSAPPGGYAQGGYPQQGYAPPKKGVSGGAIAAIIIICLAVLGVPLLIAILLPALNHVRAEAQKAKCAANLTQFAAACTVYANSNKDGEYPDSIVSLLKSTSYPADILVCPASNDTVSTTSTFTMVDDSELKGHCSYVYVGKGLISSAADSQAVLAYEPLSNHHDKGIHVLYADLSVRFLQRYEAQQLIQQLESAPPRAPRPHHKPFGDTSDDRRKDDFK